VTQKELTAKALALIEAHERECVVRYQSIERRLDSGAAKFVRLEQMIYGLYALVLGSVLVPLIIAMG
tara:strand:- start:869 stop:1069 length:201 start_codon:yes stop_codon:yes gene_type:complete